MVYKMTERRTFEVSLGEESDNREIKCVISTDYPVRTPKYEEILSHAPGAIDLSLAPIPVVEGHDARPVNIGVLDNLYTDGHRLHGTIQIGNTGRANELWPDIKAKIVRYLSVGWEPLAQPVRSAGTATYHRWRPIECSFVGIPADPNARTRNFSKTTEETQMENDVVIDTKEPVSDGDRQTRDNLETDQIRAVGKHFGMSTAAEDHIMLGGTLGGFRDYVRTQRPEPVSVVPRVEVRIPHAGNLRSFRSELYAGGQREAEEQAYRAGQWARGVIFGDMDAVRWCRDHDVVYAAASTDMRQSRVLTGLAGGQSVLVPNELILPIIALRTSYGVARKRCQVHPMSSDTASIPRRTSGATAYFVGREGAPTTSDPGFDNVNLTARNVAAETRISNDYADDSVINLADFLAQEHALAFAAKEDDCLFNGDGTSTYGGILGWNTLLDGTTSLAGSVSIATINTFAEVTATHLSTLVATLPDLAGLVPAWYTSKRGEALVFGRLRGAAGGNNKGDLAGSVSKSWDGDEIVTTNAMPHGISTYDYDEKVFLLYGDMSLSAVFGDRRGMTMLVDPYSLSSYQQTKIISSERFDIVCHGYGDNTDAGPMVALVGEAS